ncbi:transmembrane protein 218 [Cotesia typhae]|uniref:transmembrane protein 218 n=1 Tax=Cotesia typhae TaxID=2053667 RepID=UPI003D699578
MTTLILGIGVGLFVILTLWLSAALIFAVSFRIDKKIGAIAITVAAIITIVLVSVPRSSEYPSSFQEKPYDQLFVWRVILLTVLVGSSLIALFGYVKYELMDFKKPQRIVNWIY